MTTPGPLELPWHAGTTIRVRHDDPHLGPLSPMAARIGSAIALAHSVDGIARALEVTVGDRYRVEVRDRVVGLRRRV